MALNIPRQGEGSALPFWLTPLERSRKLALLPRSNYTVYDAAGYMLTEVMPRNYVIFHNGAWYGMLIAAGALLIFCSLLAGLTLAVCGLDMTWLQLRSVTGTPRERKQAQVVLKLKRRGTWMLCKLSLLPIKYHC